MTLLDWPIREGYLQNEEADGELRKLYESVLTLIAMESEARAISPR